MESHRALLEEMGFCIARRQVFYKSGMRAALVGGPQKSKIDMVSWTAMADAVFGTDWPRRDIVLSIENMFGEAEPPSYCAADECLSMLQRFLPNHEIKIVFYIRRQDTFLESIFIQNIHRGHFDDVVTFFSQFEGRVVDWVSILEPVFERVGKKSINIIPFESIKEGPRTYVVKFFRSFTDLPRATILSTYDSLDYTNISLSEKGIRIARAGFKELSEKSERRQLTKLLQSQFGVNNYPRFRLPNELREEIIDQHIPINRKLVELGLVPEHLSSYYLFENAAF